MLLCNGVHLVAALFTECTWPVDHTLRDLVVRAPYVLYVVKYIDLVSLHRVYLAKGTYRAPPCPQRGRGIHVSPQ